MRSLRQYAPATGRGTRCWLYRYGATHGGKNRPVLVRTEATACAAAKGNPPENLLPFATVVHMDERDHTTPQEPYRPVVREVRHCEEEVEFSAYSPTEVFATCTEWQSAQAEISTGWTIVDTDWHFYRDDYGVRYVLVLRIERTAGDGVLPDGSRPTLAARLPWPPADRC